MLYSNLVEGIHNLIYFGNDANGIMNLERFELTNDRQDVHTYVVGTPYEAQKVIRSSVITIHYVDNNDYMTYSSLSFVGAGTTHIICLNYDKRNHRGGLRLK